MENVYWLKFNKSRSKCKHKALNLNFLYNSNMFWFVFELHASMLYGTLAVTFRFWGSGSMQNLMNVHIKQLVMFKFLFIFYLSEHFQSPLATTILPIIQVDSC